MFVKFFKLCYYISCFRFKIFAVKIINRSRLFSNCVNVTLYIWCKINWDHNMIYFKLSTNKTLRICYSSFYAAMRSIVATNLIRSYLNNTPHATYLWRLLCKNIFVAVNLKISRRQQHTLAPSACALCRPWLKDFHHQI